MGNTSIEWADKTWSPLRARVKPDAAAIAKAKGYTSLIQIAEKMAGHVGPHCERVSHGCDHCYSDNNNGRCLPSNGTGLPFDRRSRELVDAFVDEKILLEPLKWRPIRIHADRCAKTALGNQAGCTCRGDDRYRTRPLRIFVENQSDLFGEWVPDEQIDRVFAVMLACHYLENIADHKFQILTKRPERMLRYLTERTPAELLKAWAFAGDGIITLDNENVFFHEAIQGSISHDWDSEGRNSSGSEWKPWGYTDKLFPLPNVWLGVSVEDQATADARIPLLLQTPAAIRFVSYEPALAPVDFGNIVFDLSEITHDLVARRVGRGEVVTRESYENYPKVVAINSLTGWSQAEKLPGIDWLIVGGESGPGARPFDIQWARQTVQQCGEASVSCFVKQLGARPIISPCRQHHWDFGEAIGRKAKFSPTDKLHPSTEMWRIHFKDRKGADMAEWAEYLRVRKFPV